MGSKCPLTLHLSFSGELGALSTFAVGAGALGGGVVFLGGMQATKQDVAQVNVTRSIVDELKLTPDDAVVLKDIEGEDGTSRSLAISFPIQNGSKRFSKRWTCFETAAQIGH